jgi:hypothetical protein
MCLWHGGVGEAKAHLQAALSDAERFRE